MSWEGLVQLDFSGTFFYALETTASFFILLLNYLV